MKNFTLLFALLLGVAASAQQYSTGTVPLFTTTGLEYSAKIDVEGSLVTLTLVGPPTRWLGLGFGQGGMQDGGDVVIFNGTTMSDRQFEGIGVIPSVDATQNWTVTSNNISGGVRTVVATRALNTGEAGDYVFSASPSPITLVFARGESLAIAYHGGGNCGSTNASFTLGTDKFSLAQSQVYPNPANGDFLVKTQGYLQKINIYTQTGAFVRTVEVNSDEAEINVNGLQTGVYLIELSNEKEKSWKKVIIN
ncbi:MAG TPA: T9SS type A sorting domain-containing protein [Flavobacterium sp.]|jgi:hypothetical protein